MNTEELVRQAHDPQEALVAVAQALDRIEALVADVMESNYGTGKAPKRGWGYWPAAEDRPLPVEPDDDEPHKRSAEWLSVAQELAGAETLVIDSADGTTDVVIPAASAEKQERRRQFERQALKLSEHLGDAEDWTEAYALGGPRWLYHGNRDLAMSYPDSIKRYLIEDVIEDAPAEAHEIGRDLLKQATSASNPGLAMADQ